jgi:hypothetical protein
MRATIRCLECGAGEVADLEDGQAVSCGACNHSWVYRVRNFHGQEVEEPPSGPKVLIGSVILVVALFAFVAWVLPKESESKPIPAEQAEYANPPHPPARTPQARPEPRSIPNYAVSSGRTVLAKLEEVDWVKWGLWGGINEPPTLVLHITGRQWKMLSHRELVLLGYLVKSRIPEAKWNPVQFGSISPLAPVFPKYAANLARMSDTSWAIRLVDSNGVIGAEVADGGAEPWVSNGPVPPKTEVASAPVSTREPALKESDAVVAFRGVLLRAESGSTNAMLELVQMYRTGTGTETNDFEARVWEIRAGK